MGDGEESNVEGGRVDGDSKRRLEMKTGVCTRGWPDSCVIWDRIFNIFIVYSENNKKRDQNWRRIYYTLFLLEYEIKVIGE